MHDTKIAVVVREDLAVWQKLNVTAFLTSGVAGSDPNLIGGPYEDAAGNAYNPLFIQPVIVLSAPAERLQTIYRRALDKGVRFSVYNEAMFSTGNDEDNRAAVKRFTPEEMNVVGIALHAEKKLVDKITKGAKMHQ